MGSSDTGVSKAGFGLIENPITVWVTDALGTAQTKATIADISVVSGGRQREIQVLIENPSTSATIAWTVVERGTTPSPAMTSSYAAATANPGSPIPPGKSAKFILNSRFDLWVASSAAATSIAVTSTLNG